MLTRPDVVLGLDREIGGFAELVRSLDAAEWEQPSRCEGWRVADVAAHVAGAIADVTSGRVEGLDTPEVTDRQVAERRGRSPADIADELDRVRPLSRELMGGLDDAAWAGPAPGAYDMTLGEAVGSLWFGFYIHAEDIRAAVGRDSDRGPALRAGVHFVAGALAGRDWGPAVLALDGVEEVPIGDVASATDVRRVTGDPLTFVLAASGRADPAALGLDQSVNVFA